MYSVILCGGSGKRLWPLSRNNFPKQFLKLYSEYSLLQETFLRMRKIVELNKIFFVTNRENYFHVLNHIKELESDFNENQILIEPQSLNTAPAIALAIKYLVEKFKVDLDTPIFFLPSDHHIKNEKAFLSLVKKAAQEVDNNIGTIGLTPIKPETGFGYIKKGQAQKSYFKALEFKEKPNKVLAKKYLKSGKYVWNAGIYFFNARTFFEEISKYAPQISKILNQKLNIFMKNFSKLPKISIDFALSEKSKKVIVFEGNFGWSDIGSFDGLFDLRKTKNNKKHININSKNISIHSESDHVIATVGVDDLIIIENKDSILIKKKDQSSEVRKIVEYLKKKKIKELNHVLPETNSWGSFEVLKKENNYILKKIIIYPGEKIKFTKNKSVKNWIVICGIARVLNNEKEILLRENESTYIPSLTKHSLENTGKTNLEIIEVQTGNYLEEDDIIPYEDKYERQ
jgi:mannose-1-phosphate guanylyltransferase/mannose-6-phosphate isomerase